jgi:hypothetical protein
MTQTATVTKEPQQRMRALERANEVRLKRAELKRRIANGHLTAADVILELSDEAMNWSVGEVLRSQRRWGSIRARKLLAGLHISEKRPIGDLTLRQRRLIADALSVHAPQPLVHQSRAGLEVHVIEVIHYSEIHDAVIPDLDSSELEESSRERELLAV